MSRSRGAIGIVGLGLIGGSLAKSLKAKDPGQRVIGVEPDPRARALVRADGVVDRLLPEPSRVLAECEIVVLCTPIAVIEELLEPVSKRMRDEGILTDVGGVKEPIVAAARSRVRFPVAFVGAHPMFGGERGGYAEARPDRWKGGSVAVCVDESSATAVQRVADLHRGLGAEVILCTAAEHDWAAAFVSHLPYVLSSALALTAEQAGPLARKLAGRGFADMTRLAAFAYEIQGEVARRNAHLSDAAEAFDANLGVLLQALTTSSRAARSALRRAQAAKPPSRPTLREEQDVLVPSSKARTAAPLQKPRRRAH